MGLVGDLVWVALSPLRSWRETRPLLSFVVRIKQRKMRGSGPRRIGSVRNTSRMAGGAYE